jgi:hypothetical protein
MFNANWGSTVKMVFSYKSFTFYEANTCVALPNAWRRSVRALSSCYHNNTGSESTEVKTVELRWVVFHVAEPAKVSRYTVDTAFLFITVRVKHFEHVLFKPIIFLALNNKHGIEYLIAFFARE